MDRDHSIALPLVVLLLASSVGVVLVGLRICLIGHWHQIFLVWNLVLAWVPLVFALIARDCHQRFEQGHGGKWGFRFASFAWLLFFPNAPYIFTDLVHLGGWHFRNYWVDMVLILLFAWTGFLIGFVSLYMMQTVVTRWLGRVVGWLLIPVMAGLSGLGICLGRFLRWNSWDVFLNPLGILHDVCGSIWHPRSIILPALFAVFLLMSYLMLYALTRLPRMGPAAVDS